MLFRFRLKRWHGLQRSNVSTIKLLMETTNMMRFKIITMTFLMGLSLPVSVFANRVYPFDVSSSVYIIDPIKYGYEGAKELACKEAIYLVEQKFATSCGSDNSYSVWDDPTCNTDANYLKMEAVGRIYCKQYDKDEEPWRLRSKVYDQNQRFESLKYTLSRTDLSEEQKNLQRGHMILLHRYAADVELKAKIRAFLSGQNKNSNTQPKNLQDSIGAK